jgi:hypothetical protein
MDLWTMLCGSSTKDLQLPTEATCRSLTTLTTLYSGLEGEIRRKSLEMLRSFFLVYLLRSDSPDGTSIRRRFENASLQIRLYNFC